MAQRVAMIKNMLPEDSRIAELASAMSIFFMGIMIMVDTSSVLHFMSLFELQRNEFWVVIFLMFGGLQFLSIICYLKLDILRCMLSLINGCLLIWLSLGANLFSIHLTDISAFVLGISNLYGFTLNTAQMGKTWKI